MKLSPRAKMALDLAQAAGDLLLTEAAVIKKSAKVGKHISQKLNIGTGEQEIVTTVDHLIDHLIIKTLQQAYPGEFILTEESYKQIDTKKRLKQSSLWIVDPIDGTINFSLYLLGRAKEKRQHSFSVSIAWAKNGVVQLGIIHTPVLAETWVAEKGQGTWYKKGRAPWRKLVMHPSATAQLKIALNFHEKSSNENTAQLAGHKLVFPCSLAYRIAGTSVGHHDALISFKGGSKEWDVAAADIIIQEAGGQLLDAQNKPLSYNKADLVNHTLLIAGHPLTIKQLLPLIQKHSIAMVGCITHSTPIYPDGIRERFGGGVIYGSETAKKLGLDVTVITAGAKDINGGVAQLTKQGIKTIRLPRKTSNNFSNDYSGPKRILRMSSIMPSSVTKKEIQKHLPQADAWILNPIFHEVSPSLVPAKRSFIVFMDLQGLTRKVKKNKDGYYHLIDHRWTGWKQWQGKIDILRVSDEDVEHLAFPPAIKTLPQKLMYLQRHGFPLVIATQGSKPTLVVTTRGIKTVPSHKVVAVDTGGAGDSFNAGFMAGYLRHRDPIIAAAFGNATASFMVSGQGTEKVPDIATVTSRAKSILKKIGYAF